MLRKKTFRNIPLIKARSLGPAPTEKVKKLHEDVINALAYRLFAKYNSTRDSFFHRNEFTFEAGNFKKEYSLNQTAESKNEGTAFLDSNRTELETTRSSVSESRRIREEERRRRHDNRNRLTAPLREGNTSEETETTSTVRVKL